MATEETIITEPTAVVQTQPQQEIETIDVAQTAETEMPKIEAAAIEETTPLPVAEETTSPVPEPTAIETTTTLGDDDKKIKQSNLNKFYAKVKENPNYTFDQAKSDFGDIKWDEDMFLTYSKYANTRIANKYSLDVLNQKFNEKSGYTIDADIDVNTIPELGKQTPREDLVAISGASGLQLNYSGSAAAEPTKAAEPKAVEEAKPQQIKLGADQAFGPGKAQQVQYELAKKRVEGKEKTFPQGWSIAKGQQLKVDANPNNEAGVFGGYDLWNIPKDDVTRLRYYSDKMNQVEEGNQVKKDKARAFKAAYGTPFSAGLTNLGVSTGVIDVNDLVFTKQNEKDLQNRRNLQTKALKDATPVIKELADAMTHGNTYYRYFNLEKDASGNVVDYTLNVPKVADAVQRQVYQLLGDGDHSLLEKTIEEEVLKTLVYKAEESESREYFENIELPKLKKEFPEMFSPTEMGAQFVEGTTDEEIIKKAQAQVEIVAANQEKLRDKEFAPIKQNYEAAAEPLRQSYEIALAKYNEDAKALQLMVDSGNKTPEQAQTELNILNENIKNQQVVVETELKGLYEKLQDDFNRLNTKYNSKIEQEIQKQEKIVGQSINKELAAFAQKRASNPEFVKAFTEAKKRSFTLNEFAMKRGLKRDKDERTRTILDNFLLSAQKAFGGTLETYGNMWGADWLRIYGKGLEASTIITPAKVDSWTDAINPFNAAKLGGQLVGVMGPSITAGIVTSYVTGGLGGTGAAQAVIADVVGAVASWGVNNFEMSQRSFDTKFKETGDVALATDAYNSMMSFQTNEFVYHMADVLPFGKFAKMIKSPILRGLTIGGVSYAGELTQEYREGLAEKAVNAGMDPYQLIGQQTIGLGNYIKDKMGVDKFQTQGEREAATASYNYFKETAIATSPLFFGAAGGQYISAKSEAYKRSEASQKGLELFQKYIVDQNSDYKGLRQTLSTITMEKGSAFATMIAESMYAAGQIESKADRDVIVNTIKAADELIKSPSVQKMDRADRGIYTLLADNYQNTVISLEKETDPIQKEALQKRVDDLKKEMSAFATTKKTDVMQLTLSNGQTIFFTPNEMVDFVGKNPEFGYFLSTGLATISPIKGDFTANQKSTLEAINQKIDEYEAKQSPVAPKKQVAATEETAKIKFATFEDAKEYIAERIAEYDSEQAFYDSDEYAQLYPEIKKVYDSEQEFRTVATPDDAVALLESKGYNVGDKVEAVTINEMGAPMVLTGTVAILNGRPVINLDENQSTLSGDVVLRINDNWKVTDSAKAKPTEEVAPATTESLKDVDSTTNALNIALREGGKVDEDGYRWLNEEKSTPIYDAFTLQQEKDYRTMVIDKEQTIEQFISEAYHADKATGKETDLTRAVEDLLTPKTTEDAVQEQTTGEVPVQSEATTGQEVAQGKPEAEPQVVAEEGKVETATQAEEKVAAEDLLNVDTKDKTNLQKVFDFLDKLDNDLDKFGKGTAGMNLSVPVIKAIIKTAKALVATGITLQEAIRRAAAENNVSEQDAIDAIKSYTEQTAQERPAPQEPAMPSYITPTPDVEPAVGPETRTLSVWERVAKKAESEGRIEDAKKIRELAQYDPQPNEISAQKAMEIAGLFGGVQEALDAIAEDASVKPVIRIALLGLKLDGAFASGNNFNINTTLDELALSGLDYGRANAYFKEIYKKFPQLFYRAMITESLANSAAVMGNPNLPGTKMNGAVNATKRAKKQRDSFFDALSKYYAGEIDIYEFIGEDDKKFDAKTKNALKVLLNYGKLFSKEDKEKLSSLLKQLKDKGIFGMADTREDMMPILIAQMNDINGKLKIPLNENQIVEFANAMADFYEGIALTRLSDMLNGIFNDGSLSSDNLTAAAKAIMYGALNNNQTISVFAQAFNIPVLTQAQQNQLTVLAQQLANAKGTLAQSQAQYRFQQQMLYLQSQNLSWARQFSGKLKTMASLFEAYFYNAILSAANTMSRAVRGNIGRTIGRVLFGLVRGDFELLRQSFSSVFFNTKIKNTFTITTSSGATITLNLENRVNETLDGVYSSIRGLPKLSEVKRSGLNQFELMLREEKSKGKRMAMRTFIVPSGRMMSAIDAFTTPINQAITKRQVYYELIKEAYKQAGIKPKMADIYKAINQIMVPTADAYARAMEQARQDIIGSQIYSDLGFSPNGSDFPLQDPRIRKPLSREAKIYNEWLFRVKEIIDSEEFQRVKDSASSYGWEQGLGGVSIEETAKMVDEYTNKITSEITFLGRPRGSMGFLADSINNLVEKNMATKSLKFVGVSSLFVNAGFNAVNMMIRIAPGLNAVQLAKYYITGTRGAYSTKAEPEFGLPVATKLDKQQMLATVITTNVLFAAGVAALKGLYDDEEEEKDAITKKKWTGITNVRLTPAQEKLGYLPSRIYYKGEPQFDYKDSAWGPLFGFIAYCANYGIWSTDYTSNKIFVEPEKISYESLNDEDKSYIGSYIKYLFTIAGETSSIKDMSSTINGLIDFMAPDDEVETGGQIMSKLAEKKLSSFVKTAAIPYARLQGEIKGVYDAMTGAKKKEAIDFFDKVVIGTALEDVYIKTNGFDFWGEEIKDQFVIVHPLYSSKQIGETYPNNDLRELYRKNNFTPKLSMNESLVHHINPKELNGGEAEFNEMLKSFEKTIKEENEGITIETKKDNLLISYPLERNQVVEINRNTCRFVGWFFKFENGTNMKRAEAIKDKKVFREAISELYSIGRDVAIYQGVYDNDVMGVQIMKEDKRDQYNRITNRIEAWKQRYTIEKEFEFVLKWPDQYDKTLLLGETFEFKPSVTISNQIKNNLSK